MFESTRLVLCVLTRAQGSENPWSLKSDVSLFRGFFGGAASRLAVWSAIRDTGLYCFLILEKFCVGIRFSGSFQRTCRVVCTNRIRDNSVQISGCASFPVVFQRTLLPDARRAIPAACPSDSDLLRLLTIAGSRQFEANGDSAASCRTRKVLLPFLFVIGVCHSEHWPGGRSAVSASLRSHSPAVQVRRKKIERLEQA